ncbi:MAG TPA: DUF6064 family protein [Burkholderiaceae bacterium]|nr:DUF6064 family protein [Burkholderiaceae bacterium]
MAASAYKFGTSQRFEQDRRIVVEGIAEALRLRPLIGPMLGQPWLQMQIFGIAPDASVVATLGILLTTGYRPRWLLMVITSVWCLISGATLWTMGSQDVWLMPVVALLSALLAVRKVLIPRPTDLTNNG